MEIFHRWNPYAGHDLPLLDTTTSISQTIALVLFLALTPDWRVPDDDSHVVSRVTGGALCVEGRQNLAVGKLDAAWISSVALEIGHA